MASLANGSIFKDFKNYSPINSCFQLLTLSENYCKNAFHYSRQTRKATLFGTALKSELKTDAFDLQLKMGLFHDKL